MGFLSSVKDAVSSVSDIGSMLGGADFFGPLISGGLSYLGQSSANAMNAAQAEKNRQFQALMRATQYQTAVEDLKKAGLNPMLAYQQGGAGNLSGAVSAPAQNALGQFASSALQARQLYAQMQNLEEQNDKLKQEVDESKDRSRLMRQQALTEVAKEHRENQGAIIDRLLAQSNIHLQAAQARNYDANSAYTALQRLHGELDLSRARSDDEYRRSTLGRVGRQIGTGLSDLGQITNLMRGR